MSLQALIKRAYYIAANYTRKLTLNELADSIHISPSHLGHIFKETTGETPFEFIIKYRIARAKEFLEIGCSITILQD
ncbi:AraC family transcriptional regulator [Paenibacillus sp. FSL H7-0331]|uniref:helix-turn-helix domain-containing protein n=1 Tax=Paenibacillus sp. FSL H7-0331 TaxID=1920421 RepID=UPI0009F9F2E6